MSIKPEALPPGGVFRVTAVGCLLFILAVFLAVACQPASSPVGITGTPGPHNTSSPALTKPMPTGTTTRAFPSTAVAPSVTPTVTPWVTPTLSLAPVPSPTPIDANAAVDCQDDWCVYLPHLLPQRPLAGEKGGPVDTTYRYAAVRQEYPKPHSGVELQAPAGEVVMAAAAGKVVVAGDDKSVRYGYVRNFYGRLVILEHDLPFTGGPVFTLYAHLSRIDVAPGDMVEAGQPIGLVGAAGRAIGPHLHFEVRMGDSSLKSTRNPELWLPAGPGSNPATGILAGSIRDQDGDLCPVDTIVLQPVAESGEPAGEVAYLYTYQGTWWNADDFYQENFAAGGLPAGRYQVSFIYWGQVWKSLVEVFPARVTMVKLVVSPPG